MFPCRCLPIAFAGLLMAQAAAAQDGPGDINPAEQLMADILIAVAEIELDLKNRGAEVSEPPDGSGDLLDTTRDRVAALDAVDLPEPTVEVPKDDPPEIVSPEIDPPEIDLPEAVPPEVDVAKADPPVVDGTPDGIGVTPVSRNGISVHSTLFQDLTADEIAKLPQADPDRCSELGDWFLTLDLQRDFLAFFVAEKTNVRICRRLGQSWFIKRASNGNRAHLVAAIQ
ncbi:hypothetical protein [Antarctobacter sp.]|uniref:hypothetical protein n=1 Tax=Antarctobacter sp. TaxID=1872577 RepID=UPI002B26F4B6|nr:hypothetical protein [Antarctobacter sp.]